MRTPESPRLPLTLILGGGIGSGKSSVAKVFEERGLRVISADEVGRDVLASGAPAVAAVAGEWPDAVEGGVVDRARLASIVFADESELRRLEAITHPEIAHAIATHIDRLRGEDVVVEVPLQHLHIATGEEREVVRVAIVAPSDLRLARAVARGNDPDDVRRRMARQADDVAWISWADHVIDNSGSWVETEREVLSLIEEIFADG